MSPQTHQRSTVECQRELLEGLWEYITDTNIILIPELNPQNKFSVLTDWRSEQI